jgi:transglutaminase/protease-like cytokinesis protein 3
MKKTITTLLVLFSINANAQVFGFKIPDAGKLFDNAKAAIEKAANIAQEEAKKLEVKRQEIEIKRQEEEKKRELELAKKEEEQKAQSRTQVSKSILQIVQDTEADVKWVMFVISKNAFKENQIFNAIDGKSNAKLIFRDGPGVYNVKVYKNKSVSKYTSYEYLREFEINNTDEKDSLFLLPSQLVESDAKEIIELAHQLTQNIDDQTEKFLALHDYVIKNITYDHENLNNGKYVNMDYTALEVLNNKTGICAGYSHLLAALARSIGIRTKVVHGKALSEGKFIDHAWNEVLLNNEWKIVDSTWNVEYSDLRYLFPKDSFFNIDHKKERDVFNY